MKSLITVFVILILLLLAAWQLGQAGLLAAKAWAAPVLIEKAWERGEETGRPHLPWPWADGGPTAKFVAPRLHITRYVLNGDTMRNLAFGPVLQQSTGGTIVFGHRDTHFRFLEFLERGDYIYFERENADAEKWIVQQQDIVPADELYYPKSNSSPYMMFITCYPFGDMNPNSKNRFVVWLQKS